MLPVVGQPMIARVIDWLAIYGVTSVIFSLGYQPDAFVAGFGGDRYHDVELHYAIEDSPLDTAGAIRFAAESGDALEERLIVVNGDILTDLDLGELIAFHDARRALATIALTPVEDPSAYGVVDLDDDGRVRAFVEKPTREQAPSNLINAGTYVLEPEVIRSIPTGRRVSIEREIFPATVQNGGLYAMTSDAYWLDTGTPERFLQAQHDVLHHRRVHAEMPTANELRSGVHVVEGAQIKGDVDDGAFIGALSSIEVGARVRDSVLGASVLIGRNATVTSSVILDGASIGEGATVQSSIIGPRAHVGARAALRGLCILGVGAIVDDDASFDGARVPEVAN
jgi:NDP-sugar pyrophosphorylase family protein